MKQLEEETLQIINGLKVKLKSGNTLEEQDLEILLLASIIEELKLE
jgi:hypothetical protein